MLRRGFPEFKASVLTVATSGYAWRMRLLLTALRYPWALYRRAALRLAQERALREALRLRRGPVLNPRCRRCGGRHDLEVGRCWAVGAGRDGEGP
jgi:hypothetical protein